MPATALDPKTALVVIDLQKGLAAYPTVHPMPGVVANAARLADAFRGAGLPVVLVTVAFSADGGDRFRARWNDESCFGICSCSDCAAGA